MTKANLILGFLLAWTALPANAQDASAQANFSVKQVNGVWWLIGPDGHPFLSKGVDDTKYAQDKIQHSEVAPLKITNDKKYGSPDAWRKAVGKRLVEYGFNSLGAWSDPLFTGMQVDDQHHMAEARVINIGSQFVSRQFAASPDGWMHHHEIFPDVFDPAFKQFAEETADKQCRAERDNPWLLGWFSDNELCWCADWRTPAEQLVNFLNSAPASAGHKAAVALVQSRYPDIAHFNVVWKTNFASWKDLDAQLSIAAPYRIGRILAQNTNGVRKAKDTISQQYLDDCDAFAGKMAEEYFRITTQAIRRADPNHLLLGCRFAIKPPPTAVYAAAKYLDVVSFNCYEVDPTKTVAFYANASGRPLLIGEFCFRATDSGLPNTKGAGPIVATQKDRADAFEKYVRAILVNPNIVGYHWFEHADEPKEGRFDGENSNYGIVDINDNPYAEIVARMTQVNGEADTIHQGAKPVSP